MSKHNLHTNKKNPKPTFLCTCDRKRKDKAQDRSEGKTYCKKCGGRLASPLYYGLGIITIFLLISTFFIIESPSISKVKTLKYKTGTNNNLEAILKEIANINLLYETIEEREALVMPTIEKYFTDTSAVFISLDKNNKFLQEESVYQALNRLTTAIMVKDIKIKYYSETSSGKYQGLKVLEISKW